MNKTYITYVCLFCIIIALSACDFTREKRLGKTNYYLFRGSAGIVSLHYQYPDQPGTFYGILEGQIGDVYWNEQYILATQHYGVNSDSIKGYYIVKMLPPVERGVPWKKTDILSKEECEQMKKELQLDEKEMSHTRLD